MTETEMGLQNIYKVVIGFLSSLCLGVIGYVAITSLHTLTDISNTISSIKVDIAQIRGDVISGLKFQDFRNNEQDNKINKLEGKDS